MSVGTAVVIGVIRILKGWPIHVMIISGYVIVTALTFFSPPEIIGIAYDSGGVTTSTITTSIKGRNPMLDGFGLIAFACLAPIIFILAYNMVA